MRLIDLPISKSGIFYDNLINQIVDKLRTSNEVIAIYQLGSVSTPGISDLDILCVFRDEIHFDMDLKNILDPSSNYIMVHNPYGTTVKYLKQTCRFTAFTNFKQLYTCNNYEFIPGPETKINNLVEEQIAIEYLLKFFINFITQIKLNTLKVRNLLLEIKALKKDLTILGMQSHIFYRYILDTISIRDNWFDDSGSKNKFLENINLISSVLEDFMVTVFEDFKFYFPAKNKFVYCRNYYFTNDNKFRYTSNNNIISDKLFFPNNRKIFNLINRLNKYFVFFPWEHNISSNNLLLEKHRYEMSHIRYNRLFIKYFSPLKGPLINSDNIYQLSD